MSVTEVSEQWQGRGVSFDENGVITATRQFLVETDDNADDEATVEAALPVALYDAHPAYPRAIARYPFSIKPHESPQTWLADITYSSAPFPAFNGAPPAAIDVEAPQKPSAAQNNSTPANLRLPVYSFSRKEVLEQVMFDVDDRAIVNSAGDPYEGVMAHRDRLLVHIKYWSVNLTTDHILRYWNKVNLTAFMGFSAHSLLVTDFSFQSVNETMEDGSGNKFLAMLYEADITLEYREPAPVEIDPERRGWRLNLLDAGLRSWVPDKATGKLQPITEGGSQVTAPQRLNGEGVKIPADADLYVYNNFDIYEYIEFNTPETSPPPPPDTPPGLIL